MTLTNSFGQAAIRLAEVDEANGVVRRDTSTGMPRGNNAAFRADVVEAQVNVIHLDDLFNADKRTIQSAMQKHMSQAREKIERHVNDMAKHGIKLTEERIKDMFLGAGYDPIGARDEARKLGKIRVEFVEFDGVAHRSFAAV